MTKKTYIVETVSTFRIKYLVVTNDDPSKSLMQGMIDNNEMLDWKQDFLGEKITGVIEASPRELELIGDTNPKVNELAEVVINDDEENKEAEAK